MNLDKADLKVETDLFTYYDASVIEISMVCFSSMYASSTKLFTAFQMVYFLSLKRLPLLCIKPSNVWPFFAPARALFKQNGNFFSTSVYNSYILLSLGQGGQAHVQD